MGVIDFNDEHYLVQLMNNIQFDDFLLKGVLGFLLFGGALNIELSHLKDQKLKYPFLLLQQPYFRPSLLVHFCGLS